MGCKRLTLEGLLRLKEGFDERVDIRFGVITRERNADRAVDDGGGKMQSLEHMAAVAFGAGGTGGDVDSFCLQAVDDALRAKAGEGEIYDVRRVLLSDEDEAGNLLKHFTAEVPKLRHMGNIGCGIGFLAGGGKAADTGEVLGAGTEISLS